MADLIERQAAIDALNVGTELLRRVLDNADIVGVERAKFEWGLELIESCISDIKDLPSAQPERKKGKWEKRVIHEGSPFLRRRYYCSACGDWQTFGPTPYCCWCGAKMEES